MFPSRALTDSEYEGSECPSRLDFLEYTCFRYPSPLAIMKNRATNPVCPYTIATFENPIPQAHYGFSQDRQWNWHNFWIRLAVCFIGH
jgi:hypothetical protein